MQDAGLTSGLERIVRGLSGASKALRLYPSSSPIPRQAVDSAAESLASFLAAEPVLSFKVVRDGFAWGGQTVAPGAPGATDLADALRDHGIAELDFTPGVSANDLLTFLGIVLDKPETVRARGGLAASMAATGIDTIRVSEVSLTVVDPFAASRDDDADAFLRELASDPERVGAWLSAASKGDPAALAAGLADLQGAAGADNLEALVQSLTSAIAAQGQETRDAVVAVGMEGGATRELLGRVFTRMPSGDLAKTLCGGGYGKNMLSMSAALTRLPLAQRYSDVLAQVRDILPDIGHSEKELAFLDHMLEARSAPSEAALVDAKPAYRQVADAVRVDAAQVAGARDDVLTSARRADDSAIATMLTLLDQQRDFGLYRKTLDSLAGMVPALLERGRLDLAARIVSELAARESQAEQPWPDLTERLRAAIAEATSRRSMKALIAAVAADPSGVREAHVIMQRAGEAATATFVEEALAVKPNGLAIAEQIVGRRLVDMLSAAAPRVQWFNVAPLVARLATESDARAQAAIEAVLRRSDEQSRREAAAGLASARGPFVLKHLGSLLRDPSAEVAIAAARAVGRSSSEAAAGLLGARFDEIDSDGKDFLFARELIGALAHCADPAAQSALERIAARRALIKRGHFAEVQDLAKRALAQRTSGGDGR
ncbi:MAG TPA: hypothetical protein VF902_04395 [Coriobacteriia bacterium]